MDNGIKCCALCTVPITPDIDSDEHVIPASIGGRWVVRGFICKSCNDEGGLTSEAEISNRFGWFSLTAGIKRESGKKAPRPIIMKTDDGKKVLLKPNGVIESWERTLEKIPTDDGRLLISGTRPSMNELREMLSGLKRKHPDIDIESAIGNARVEASYKPITHNFGGFGSDAFWRSVVKTVCAVAWSLELNEQDCEVAVNYLRKGEGKPFNLFYGRDVILNRPMDQLFHCVSLRSDNERNLLLGYVEYFGVFRGVVMLSDSYKGGDVDRTYAVDPVLGKEIDLTVDLHLSDQEVDQFQDGAILNGENYLAAFEQSIAIALSLSEKSKLDMAINSAVDKVCNDMGIQSEQEIAPEQALEFSRRIAEAMAPFFLDRIRAKHFTFD
ncbi:HNH endonuclease [Chromobacterium rhizoryzae]|uniref:HNH endonuclease n=1 Tax=Chromobacterium rhizoryzae TaxID=1778675 RepID=UPI001D067F47|nr:HNH endonuclease [Chromobacterium rhizoryzae]